MNYLPNLFIPGAQKAGTTSLYNFLKKHPGCVMQKRHGIDVFTDPEKRKKLPSLYRETFKDAERRTGEQQYRCDSTPHHMYNETFPRYLSENLKDECRFIFLLRDPVSRAYSAYWHMRLKNREFRSIQEVFSFEVDSLDEMITREERSLESAVGNGSVDTTIAERRYGGNLFNFEYLKNSHYRLHIDRFIDHFEKDRMLFVRSEELRQNPVQTLNKIWEFLDLEQLKNMDFDRDYNKTLVPHTRLLGKVADRLRDIDFVPDRLIEALFYRAKPPLETSLRQSLEKTFEPEIRKLEKQLEIELTNNWLKTL